MGFHPRDRFSINRIAPTENDMIFRHQVVQGDVHDQTASLLGGVAGHAGLFSNALDVGILMEMVLRNGSYGGVKFIDSAVVSDFTKPQFPGRDNRRGLGFDKPPLKPGDPSPTSDFVSPLSYGHSGFTGTYVWVDPAEELVYVFLSNRVYPDATNAKITQMNIRTNIQDVIYKAIINGRSSTKNAVAIN
jgi:CubicO group peptidase (beta-lactamase class C family)